MAFQPSRIQGGRVYGTVPTRDRSGAGELFPQRNCAVVAFRTQLIEALSPNKQKPNNHMGLPLDRIEIDEASPVASVQNRILASLPIDVFQTIRDSLERVTIKRRTILLEQFQPIEHVYFIEQGFASVYARTQRDGPVEVSLVGRLGVVGVPIVLGQTRSPHRCTMQVTGEALRIPAETLARYLDRDPQLRRHLLKYVHVLLVQNAQTVLCNGRHSVQERLSRWLLIARDRLDEDAVPVTHELLSISLGVRRPGITDCLNSLEQAGIVRGERGAVTILDRPALEKRACECYRIITAEFQRLLTLDLPASR
jgi:CRP-like cAMP-binding protein